MPATPEPITKKSNLRIILVNFLQIYKKQCASTPFACIFLPAGNEEAAGKNTTLCIFAGGLSPCFS
jgi:hypothetical protein